MEANFGSDSIDNVIKKLTQEYLQKLQSASPSNIGIYNALKILFEKADIKELGIFLSIAEHQPVKTETLVGLLEGKISKSTIYRKLSEYEPRNFLIKDEMGYWKLGPELEPLGIIAEIHNLLKKEE